MKALFKWLAAEIGRNPIVLAPLTLLAATMFMNARTGYQLGNESLIVAAIFVAIALLTAYAAKHGLELPPSARKRWLLGFMVIGLGVDQLSGWQTMGLLFADGQVARNSKGTDVASRAEAIQRLRDERAKIGITRAIGAIAPEEQRECKLAPKGVDPVGERCTKLRAELGAAKRAAEIDEQLPRLVTALGRGDQVASGQVQFTVPLTIAQTVVGWAFGPDAAKRVTGDRILFWIELLITAVVGFGGSVGFWLVGSHGAPEPTEDRFDPLALPAPAQWPGLPPPPLVPRGPDRSPPSVALLSAANDAPAPAAATNIINVGTHGGPVPPRIAARRATG